MTAPQPNADSPGKLTRIAAAIGSGNRAKTAHVSVPPALADVALIDGPTVAAAAAISLAKFHKLVATGEAPQPAFRAPRMSRWRLADVRDWLAKMAERGSDPAAAKKLMLQARRATKAAAAKRSAAKSQPPVVAPVAVSSCRDSRSDWRAFVRRQRDAKA